MAPLRVLYMHPAVDFGGAERQATYLMAGLPRHGVEVVPLVGPGQRLVDELAEVGVHALHHTGLPSDELAPRSQLERARLVSHWVRSFFRMSRELEAILRRAGCDLVFASRPFSWVVGGRIGTRLGLPVVWRAGTLFNHAVQPAWLRLCAHLWPPRGIVCTSHAVKDALARHVSAPMFVLHNGVDTRRFSPRVDRAAARASLGLDGEAPVVAMAARLSPEKGISFLIDACRVLRAEVPGVRVLVAGDGQWRGRFDHACREAGLDETVRRLAFVRDVERIYAASDVVVSTSETEGCPNTLLEAMAMARPVVATAVDGTTEILRGGLSGILVWQGSPAAFAREVAELLRAPERRRELGEAALATVRQRFALDVQIARLAGILHDAAGRRHEPLAASLAS
ncbi:MAG TPA: glycosyltransferase family 4 protein [Polyangia bacterium]